MSQASTDEYALHQRLLSGDETASADAFERFLEPVTRHLVHRFPILARYDPVFLEETASDAILEYVRRPAVYRPDACSLVGFLRLVAERDMKNALPKAQRQVNERSWEDIVEESQESRKMESEDAGDRAVKSLLAADLREKVMGLFSREDDRRVCQLILGGIRDYDDYADVLGISHLPRSERDREVKRAMDRVRAKMHRARLANPFDG